MNVLLNMVGGIIGGATAIFIIIIIFGIIDSIIPAINRWWIKKKDLNKPVYTKWEINSELDSDEKCFSCGQSCVIRHKNKDNTFKNRINISKIEDIRIRKNTLYCENCFKYLAPKELLDKLEIE